MLNGNQHAARVDAWLRDAPSDISLDELLARFELTFSALCGRAHQTLGEVTLTAILDRVLYLAREKYPNAVEFELEAAGPALRPAARSRAGAGACPGRTAIRFVLVEFLTLLGNLTADILTNALHAEFARMAEPAEDSAVVPGPTRLQTSDDEGTKS